MFTGKSRYSAAEMESMRCTPMTEILRDFGFDTRHTSTGLYFSPFHEEKTPSFHIDEVRHKWFDHGNRVPGQKAGGDVFDLVMALRSCSFPEACDYLIKFNPDLSVNHDDDIIDISGSKFTSSLDRRTIDRVIPGISACSLRNYAQSERHIPLPVLNRYCSEVHYTNYYSNGMKSSPYAIGFPNIDGEWALRWPSRDPKRGKISTGQNYTVISPDGKFVKAPVDTLGLRLDSLIVNPDGDFVYTYTETIAAQKDLRKVDVYLSGDIMEQDRRLYNIPEGKPLTFYIASLASFVDKTPRYLLKVVERQAEANSEYNIEFEQGKSDVKPELADNAGQIALIKKDLRNILNNDTYILDSIIVTSFASPEGTITNNHRLSGQRSRSVSEYFDTYVRHITDSLRNDRGISMTLDGEVIEEEQVDVKFKNIIGGENWFVLDQLVEMDTTLTDNDKIDYFDQDVIKDLDARERVLSKKPYYAHLRGSIYPKTRLVRFNFMLHRKGMLKDTLHTQILDSLYMKGVQAIEDRDFETAVEILRPYRDYNTAVAFTAMDYNISALSILETLPKNAQVEYMMAIIKSRQGDDQAAVQHYINSVKLEPSYKYRGNLDPEISVLIQRYNLNAESDEDFDF